MPRPECPDVASLYHLNSSNSRGKTPDYWIDRDNTPSRFRTYPDSPRFVLPGRDYALGEMGLADVLQRRRSVRNFAGTWLGNDSLGRLLHLTYGVRGFRQVEGNLAYDRPIPSAGGLYPLEVYVAIRRVTAIPDGVYHYDPRAHALEQRRQGDLLASLADMTIDQPMLRSANAVVLTSGIAERTMWKYGQRGYRYVWIEAGHLGQNTYLAAAAMGLGAVAIGGFFDQEIAEFFRLPEGEVPLYLICVGLPGEP